MNYCETREDFIAYAEHLYKNHVADSSGMLPQPIDLQELLEMKFPKEPVIDAEIDYRRGFDHGFCYAAELVMRLHRNGYSRPMEIFNILFNFEECQLVPWRHRAAPDVNKNIRCKLHGGHPTLEIEKWRDVRNFVFNRDGNSCVACGRRKDLHCDHVTPVCDGGLPTRENLQTLCKQCNQEKGSR